MRLSCLLPTFALLLCSACQSEQAPTAALTAPAPLAEDDPGYVAENPRLAELIGMPGPVLSLQTIDGSLIDLSTLYGEKPLYLKLWATYCIPCRVQMPGFEEIYQAVGQQMHVIAVNAGVGDDPKKVRTFANRTGMTMPVAIDDGSLGAWVKMQETPLHLVMGRDGRIIHAGHQDGPELHAAIEQALSSPIPPDAPVVTSAVERMAALSLDDRVPTIALQAADESRINIGGDATDRPRALLFTSIWCEDYLEQTEPESARECRRVREQVNALAETGNVEWRGIVSHLWTTPESLGAYEAQTEQKLPFAVDTEGTAFRRFGIQRFPAVALIDAKGTLVRIVGPDDADLVEAVEQLGAPPSAP